MDKEKEDIKHKDWEKPGTIIPDWVQKTFLKSRLGFHRVHDELKRMYDERTQRVTDIENKPAPKVESPKRVTVFSRLFNFISSVKCALSSSISEPYESIDYYKTSSNMEEGKKERETQREANRLTAGRSLHSNKMPHAELLKSNVYNNDRVVAENKMEDSMEFVRESQVLYSEIEENEMTSNDNISKRNGTRVHPASPAQNKKDLYKFNTFPRNEEHVRSKLNSTKDNRLTDDFYQEMGPSTSKHSPKEPLIFTFDSDTDSAPGNNEKTAESNRLLSYRTSTSLPNIFSHRTKSRHHATIARSLNVVSISSKGNNKLSSGRTGTEYARLMHVRQQTDIKEVEEINDIDNRTFYDYTVEEVVDCFKKCAFINLSQVCQEEQLDGEYFRDITEEDLVREPFLMNWFHISKLFKVLNGWRPKTRPCVKS